MRKLFRLGFYAVLGLLLVYISQFIFFLADAPIEADLKIELSNPEPRYLLVQGTGDLPNGFMLNISVCAGKTENSGQTIACSSWRERTVSVSEQKFSTGFLDAISPVSGTPEQNVKEVVSILIEGPLSRQAAPIQQKVSWQWWRTVRGAWTYVQLPSNHEQSIFQRQPRPYGF